MVLILIVCLFMPHYSFSQAEGKYKIIADVSYSEAHPGDSIYLVISPFLHLGRNTKSYLSITDQNRVAHFNIDQPYPYGYITIKKSIQFKAIDELYPITDKYFWENGDKIYFNVQRKDKSDINGYKTTFSGKSVIKYNLINKIRKTYEQIQSERRKKNKGKYGKYNPWDFTPLKDTIATKMLLSILDSSKKEISKISFEALKADILFLDQLSVLEKLRNIRINNVIFPKNLDKDSIINKMKTDYLVPLNNPDQNKYFPSGNFNGFYTSLFQAISYLNGNSQEINVAKDIINNTTGVIRESLLTSLLTSIGFNIDTLEIYELVAGHITTSNNMALLDELKGQKNVNIGSYILVDVNGAKIPMSTFKGKLLIIDIWYTGCGGCVLYRKNILSKIERNYQNDSRVQIVSISIDKNINTWKKSIGLDTYTNPLGVNLYTGGLAELHPLIKDLGINFMPMPMLVDTTGKIIEFDSPSLKDYNLFRQLIEENLNK
ncbi:TlpA disulfide reductase family protein [Sphingobacterium siyangense]|uniref:TlpA family protein disulfide reductase n=1 Tax=Sphingobacterium siyangense TaxID=459529 RepID=UPI002FD9329A